ncbi:MAG: hypothetical protein KAS23_05820 [Anaerohalosphaera sp.]|nr:hypothetical protein [Anaerohalosphaera sp.]
MKAIAVPAGIGRDGRCFDEPLNILVSWKSSNTDKLHQVYVNGRFAGVTDDVKQRRIRIYVPTCWEGSSRIAVYAVDPELQYEDHRDQLDEQSTSGRVVLRWARTQSMPLGGRYEVYSNNGNGEIDHSKVLVGGKGMLWLCGQNKSGFCLSRFGLSDFGYDGSACPGFGRGEFGAGEFGFDADVIEWVSDELESGRYKFAIRIPDRYGMEQFSAESDEIAVIRRAKGVDGLGVDSCKEDGILKLKIG